MLITIIIFVIIVTYFYWRIHDNDTDNFKTYGNSFKSSKKIENNNIIPKPIIHKIEKPKVITHEYNFDFWKQEIIDDLDKCNTVSDLLIIKKPEEVTYGDLLFTFEWRYKRLMILLRDDYECLDCNKKHESNHVHHNYYINKMFPWQVPDDALETLCSKCHRLRHENKKIPVYEIDRYGNKTEVQKENPICSRCGGKGVIDYFLHYENGICFKCWGNLINSNVFIDALNQIYDLLNYYDNRTEIEKEKAFSKINSITYTKLVEALPNLENYKPRFNHHNNYLNWDGDDDLPF